MLKPTLLILVLILCAACSEREAVKPAEPTVGEVIFNKNCKVCHAQGLNGAPILGNQAMWAERKKQSLEVLVQHASEGFGLMPAKGGNTDLTQEQITQAIEYMLSKVNPQDGV